MPRPERTTIYVGKAILKSTTQTTDVTDALKLVSRSSAVEIERLRQIEKSQFQALNEYQLKDLSEIFEVRTENFMKSAPPDGPLLRTYP